MTEQQAPVFSIEKVYAKDISLEIPNAPQVFLERENPSIELQLHDSASTIEDGLYEVVVTATITAKNGENTVFLVEVAQAGVFQLRNLPVDNLDPILGVACPNIIFPYLRETVSDLVTRAGFPPVLLAPINFEALYQQRMQQAQASGEVPVQ
ncbi:MAG: protein-export chaperone SecB [Sterolibacterium sp.]|nr:protein-export chaperone SecB [Sterolibacterium sp.]